MAGYQLLTLDEVELSGDRLFIENIELTSNQPLHLQRASQLAIQFDISLSKPWRVTHITADRIIIGEGDKSNQSSKKPQSPPKLSTLADQLTWLPTEKIVINALQLPASYPAAYQQLSIQFHNQASPQLAISSRAFKLQGTLSNVTQLPAKITLKLLDKNDQQRFFSDWFITEPSHQRYQITSTLNADLTYLLKKAELFPQRQPSGQLAVELQATVPNDLTQLEQQFALQLTVLPETHLSAVESITEPIIEQFSWSLYPDAPITLSATQWPLKNLTVSGDQIRLDLTTQQQPGRYQLLVAALDCQAPSVATLLDSSCNAQFQLSGDSDAVRWPGGQVKKLTGKITGMLSLDQQQLAVAIDAGSQLTSNKVIADQLKIHPLKITIDQPVEISASLASKNIEANATQLTIHYQTLRYDTLAVSGDVLLSKLRYSNENISGQLQTKPLSITASTPQGDVQIEAMKASGQFELENEQLQTQWQLIDSQNRSLLKATITSNLQQKQGRGELTMGPIYFSQEKSLASYFSQWPFAGDLREGSSELTSAFNWQINQHGKAKLKGTFNANFSDLSGYYDTIALVALNSNIRGKFNQNRLVTETSRTTIKTILAPIAITDSHINWRVNSDDLQLSVEHLETHVAEGTISSKPFTLKLQQSNPPIEVQIKALDLNQLMMLADYDQLTISGHLSGHLPIAIEPKGITIENGQLSAEPPGGVIRYRHGSSDINPAVKLATDALSNYHYQQLQAELNYSINGRLDASVKMQGNNPEFQGGRQINLNLNLTDNIPALINSLNASRSITDQLDQRLNSNGN